MMIKICGITRREDAEAAVEAGASALGFVFYPKSPRFVTPERAAELGRDLKVWKVGVFVDETAASVEAVSRRAGLDVAQIYGGETPALRVWRAFRVVEWFTPDAAGAEAVLLDGPANGIPFNWTIAGYPLHDCRGSEAGEAGEAGEGLDGAQGVEGVGGVRRLKVILAGGLDASNVAEAIRIARPWGVDASSRLESAPGVKDHAKMRQFIREASL